MSDARSLIVEALSRLLKVADDPAASAEPKQDTRGPELSEEAILAAFGTASTGAVVPSEGPIVELGEADEIDPIEFVVEEPEIDVVVEAPATEAQPAESPRTAVTPMDTAATGAAPEPAESPRTAVTPMDTTATGAAPEPAATTAKVSTNDALLEQALQALETVDKRDDIARVVLGYSQALFSRAALFVIKREMVAGWEGQGTGMTKKTIRAILIPLTTPSVFKTVYETKVLYYGGVPRTTVNDLFLAAIDTQTTPQRVIVLPFVLKGKVVCTLYADGGEADELSPRMIGQLYQLGRAVSGAFEKLIMEAKKKVQMQMQMQKKKKR